MLPPQPLLLGAYWLHANERLLWFYDLLEWYGDGTRVLIGCVVPSPTLQVKLWT